MIFVSVTSGRAKLSWRRTGVQLPKWHWCSELFLWNSEFRKILNNFRIRRFGSRPCVIEGIKWTWNHTVCSRNVIRLASTCQYKWAEIRSDLKFHSLLKSVSGKVKVSDEGFKSVACWGRWGMWRGKGAGEGQVGRPPLLPWALWNISVIQSCLSDHPSGRSILALSDIQCSQIVCSRHTIFTPPCPDWPFNSLSKISVNFWISQLECPWWRFATFTFSKIQKFSGILIVFYFEKVFLHDYFEDF